MYDLVIEQALIRVMLENNYLIESVTLIGDDFSPEYRGIYQAIRDLRVEKKPIVGLQLYERFGDAYSRIMSTSASVDDFDGYLVLLKSKAIDRKYMAMSVAITEIATSDASPEDKQMKVTSIFMDALNTIGASPFNAKSSPWKEVLDEFTEFEAKGKINRAIKTGISAFDENIVIKKGDLVVIGARPGIGKTVLMGTIALYLTQEEGKRVEIFTVEMTPAEMVRRFAKMISGINPIWKLLRGRPLSKKEIDDYGASVAYIGKSLMSGTSPKLGITYSTILEEIISKVITANYGSEKPLDLIIIDHVSMVRAMVGWRKGGARHEELSYIISRLKELAIQLGKPIILAIQLSRDIEKRGEGATPTLSDLAESSAAEWLASAVCVLSRDKEGNIVMDLLKNREGTLGQFKISFDGTTGIME